MKMELLIPEVPVRFIFVHTMTNYAFLHQGTFRKTGGFTLVEILIGITIFSVGMAGILVLLQSTINTAILARHEVVASNLLREKIELIHNNRNSNIRSLTRWDTIRTENIASSFFGSGFYIVENNFNTTNVTYDG
jgi:prepilin-type N-terminal cleavage/methylation domain-containing protein